MGWMVDATPRPLYAWKKDAVYFMQETRYASGRSGCVGKCSKASVLTYVLHKEQNVNGFKTGTSGSSQI